MARAIDGDELLGIERLLDTDIVRQSKTASWLLDQVLHDIQAMPTLTPPNEPLTMEELREMEQSTPVWWDYIPCWVLVRRGSVLVFGSEPHKVENLFGYFYRRPPEGEEEP